MKYDTLTQEKRNKLNEIFQDIESLREYDDIIRINLGYYETIKKEDIKVIENMGYELKLIRLSKNRIVLNKT